MDFKHFLEFQGVQQQLLLHHVRGVHGLLVPLPQIIPDNFGFKVLITIKNNLQSQAIV